MKNNDKTMQRLREELKKNKEELELQRWGLHKTNESIKILYKELEEKNKRLRELDQLKSDFISTVSHELRSPLTITKEGISLVLDEIPGKINKSQREVLADAKSSIDRLARMINDLLDVSKIEAGKAELKKKFFTLNALLQQLLSTFKIKIKNKGLELKVDLPKKEIEVYADPDKITQIFTNLLYNAIKFTAKGFVRISVKEKKNEIECSVADTGIGISKEKLPRLFDKFQQFGRVAAPGGEKGTGLGLSIAKGLVEMHRGRIWIESELDKGTKFTFTLQKYSAEDALKEYIDKGINEAAEKDTRFSLMIISLGEKESIPTEMIRDFKNILQQRGHLSSNIFNTIFISLPHFDKEDIIKEKDALEQLLKKSLTRYRLAEKVQLRFRCLTYPDEIKSAEEAITKIKIHHGEWKWKKEKY